MKQTVKPIPIWLQNTISVLLALYMTYVFLPKMFELGVATGIGYLLSCAIAFYNKTILRDPRVIVFISVGYIFTNLATESILPMVYENLFGESIFTTFILLIVFFVIYLKGKELKDMGAS